MEKEDEAEARYVRSCRRTCSDLDSPRPASHIFHRSLPAAGTAIPHTVEIVRTIGDFDEREDVRKPCIRESRRRAH
jgi:hypothetical protein